MVFYQVLNIFSLANWHIFHLAFSSPARRVNRSRLSVRRHYSGSRKMICCCVTDNADRRCGFPLLLQQLRGLMRA